MNETQQPLTGFLAAMHDQTRIRIGRSLAGFSITLGVTGLLGFPLIGRWDFLIGDFIAHNGVLAIGLGALTWVVLPAQPRNGAVWALTWSAFFASIFVGASLAGTLLTTIPDFTLATAQDLSQSDFALSVAMAQWPATWSWIPAFTLVITLGFLLFPDGKLPSRRWRWVGRFSIIAITVISSASAWLFRPSSTIKLGASTQEYPGVLGTLVDEGFGLIMLAALLSIVALVLRYRRSSGETRRQILLIAWGGVSLTGALVAGTIIDGVVSEGGSISDYLALAGEVLLILAFAVAILKYRLYEIDVVISKTVTYVSMAAFIAAVYIGLVVGISKLIGGRSSFVLSIAATVVVAIAFQPVRRWVQQVANRLVYGERATPYEVLARFSHRAAEASDAELLARLPQLIVEGTSASQATLWVRAGQGYRAGATWPEGSEARVLTSSGRSFHDPDADYSLPVFHADELLGGISLVTARGETVTPPEKDLLENLAAGMGLALWNTRLTSRLREQVAELEASRERILAAADAARRALENDLDSGPQQQLVALKVKLGPTRKRAEQMGATKTAGVLAQLESDSGDAIQAVRDFAGGVYPPLLQAEGLAVAIAQQARKAPMPVSVNGDGIQRYSREIEAAVYFAVLEALQNTAKYAEAGSASVTLADTGRELLFEVRDDGRGFDPALIDTGAGLAGIADRMDTVGGVARVDSTPGEGSVVAGSVPIDQLVSA